MSDLDRIIDCIKAIKPGADIKPDDELISTGILASVDVMLLATAICNEFEIKISPLDLKEENFHTVRAIADLIEMIEDRI